MRIGSNPTKEDNQLSASNYHRVIIPVYIPNLSGYFEDGLRILKACLQSLFNTTHNKTAITIINNACCEEVSEYLLQELRNGKLDQIIFNKENRGKIDPPISAIRGVHEPLVTITDADVLFLKGWQEETERIHHNIPGAGMVCPVPSSKAGNIYTTATWVYGLLNFSLHFEPVPNPEAMFHFAHSIGNDQFYNQAHLSQFLTITCKNEKVAVGGGHFVATVKRSVFKYAPPNPSFKKISGGSENKYLDEPNDKGGFLRVATLNNYAYHMGNKYENWMTDTIPSNSDVHTTSFTAADFVPKVPFYLKFGFAFRYKLISYFLKSTFYKKTFAKSLGLKKEYIDSYF
jgi:hypothetical protein